MTPKEKAIELCDKFLRTYKVSLFPPFNKASDEAKQCALIAVDEIINSSPSLPILGDGGTFGEDIELSLVYWEEVKQEIEKL
jgi:hypothetical protein